MLLLNDNEVGHVLTMPLCLEALEEGYRELGAGRGVIRPRVHSYMATSKEGVLYKFKSMEGGLESTGVMALRIASEHNIFRQIYGGIRMDAIPAAPGGKFLGLILLFSTETTELLAIMPDGYLQSQRVGATWALAAKYLAKRECKTIGLFGSGQQAPAFLEAHFLARPTVSRAKVWSPNPDHRRAFADKMSRKLRIEVVAVDQPREVMKDADIVMTATNARLEPLIKGEWAEEGMHASCISPGQMDDNFFKKVDLWVAHHRLTSLIAKTSTISKALGGMMGTPPSKTLDYDQVPTLADLLSGRHPGRTDDRQITYFGGMPRVKEDPSIGEDFEGFGSSGTGVQFAAIGYQVYKKARELGLGREIPTDWFLQDLHP